MHRLEDFRDTPAGNLLRIRTYKILFLILGGNLESTVMITYPHGADFAPIRTGWVTGAKVKVRWGTQTGPQNRLSFLILPADHGMICSQKQCVPSVHVGSL